MSMIQKDGLRDLTFHGIGLIVAWVILYIIGFPKQIEFIYCVIMYITSIALSSAIVILCFKYNIKRNFFFRKSTSYNLIISKNDISLSVISGMISGIICILMFAGNIDSMSILLLSVFVFMAIFGETKDYLSKICA